MCAYLRIGQWRVKPGDLDEFVRARLKNSFILKGENERHNSG